MRRAYFNQWTFHHGDAALPEPHPEHGEQLGMAVYNIPAKVHTWTGNTGAGENGNDSLSSSTTSRGGSPKKPSKLLAILLGLFVLFLLAFTSTLIAWGVLSDGFESHKGGIGYDENGDGEGRICVSDDCTQVAGDIVRFFDKTANPCEDFYQYVCGKYSQDVPIPRDKDKTGTMDQMEHRVKMQLRTLFEAPIDKNESFTSRMVKQFYRACMNVDDLKNRGLEPLKEAVEDLGGWPAGIEIGWNESQYDWEASNGALRAKYGVHSLMIITVDFDFRNNTKKMITIDQPDAENLNLVHAWKAGRSGGKSLLHSALDSMVDLALEFGADRDSVISDMEEILLFEILLDNITLTEERRRDRFRFYHPMSLAELRRTVPTIDWNTLFKTLFPSELKISDHEIIFNVVDLEYLKKLQDVLTKFTKRTLANYHIYYLADTYLRYLAPSLRDLRRASPRRYLKTPATSSIGLARWEECVDETSTLLSWRPVSEMYANRNISVNAKLEVEIMFDYLRLAADNLLRHASWLDNATSLTAVHKLDEMKLTIPDTRRTTVANESAELVREYEKIDLTNISYFDAVIQLNTFRNRVTFLSLRHSADVDDGETPSNWIDTIPASINAYYRLDKNEVVLPIALFQYPLFSSQVPRYVQYSRLGTLAGHEIMHGYDDEGRQYDERGNLRPWWSNNSSAEFDQRAECLINQFCNITDQLTDHQLNGKRTLGENLADQGGIKVAFHAYQTWKREGKMDDEERLPGLGSYTTAQAFFLSYANIWCESIRPEALALFIDEDVHALGRYRVNVPLQNFPAFADVFNCPIGSAMNPVNKCQVW